MLFTIKRKFSTQQNKKENLESAGTIAFFEKDKQLSCYFSLFIFYLFFCGIRWTLLHFTSFTYNSLQSWIFVHWMLDLAATVELNIRYYNFWTERFLDGPFWRGEPTSSVKGEHFLGLGLETSAFVMLHPSWWDQDCIFSYKHEPRFKLPTSGVPI